MDTPAAGPYQFGPFELNPASGELLKNGKRIKIQDQPLRLLVVLVENAGQVVAREEIQSRIWAENTFVDFESGLRVAVRKLRDALGDDAENPQYVETIPKRGYRLLVPAMRRPVFSPSAIGRAVGAVEASLPSTSHDELTNKSRFRSFRRNAWIVSVALLLLIAAAAMYPFLVRAQPKLTGTDTVVLADFDNSTGDPVFDGTLRQGIAVQLEQSPFLSLISEARVQRTLHLMNKPADVRLTPDIAREICVRTGSAAVLHGSIASLGSAYVVGLEATNCRTGNTLDQEQAQAARKEEVLKAVDQITNRFRRRVGESLTTLAAHDTPLAEATTSSLEALKAYSTAWKVSASQGPNAAIPFLKRAIEADPQFAVAYAALGLMYGSTGESALAADSTKRAYELRDRASDNEKFFITAYYDGRTTGNEEKAQQTCLAWAQTYPREWNPHSFLAGFIYPVLGKYERAAEEGEQAVRIEPDSSIAYTLLADNYLRLDRIAQAESVARRGAEREPLSILQRYDIAFVKNDISGMEREEALAQADSEAEDWVYDHKALVLAYAGHLQEATRLSQRAAELAQRASHEERAASFETSAALWEGFFGNASAAKRTADGALKLAQNREVEYGAAFVFALAGDSTRAAAMAVDLERQYPDDTSVRFSYLPVLRGLIAINQGEPSKAVEVLQAASPYDLSTPRSKLQGFYGAMYPVYVRGEAYLRAGQGNTAAAEFQKILDHRGIVVSDPIGALAHLQLARAYAMAGDQAKAKSAYEDFLSLWKTADLDTPVLKQAKSEYARLQ